MGGGGGEKEGTELGIGGRHRLIRDPIKKSLNCMSGFPFINSKPGTKN